jgi:hypothetical protein
MLYKIAQRFGIRQLKSPEANIESLKWKEVFYYNSLANPAGPMSGISAMLQQTCGVSTRWAFSSDKKIEEMVTDDGIRSERFKRMD